MEIHNAIEIFDTKYLRHKGPELITRTKNMKYRI